MTSESYQISKRSRKLPLPVSILRTFCHFLWCTPRFRFYCSNILFLVPIFQLFWLRYFKLRYILLHYIYLYKYYPYLKYCKEALSIKSVIRCIPKEVFWIRNRRWQWKPVYVFKAFRDLIKLWGHCNCFKNIVKWYFKIWSKWMGTGCSLWLIIRETVQRSLDPVIEYET